MANTLGEIIDSLKETPKMDKWEYKTTENRVDALNFKFEEHINKQGEAGWELVSHNILQRKWGVNSHFCIFKRKIQQENG